MAHQENRNVRDSLLHIFQSPSSIFELVRPRRLAILTIFTFLLQVQSSLTKSPLVIREDEDPVGRKFGVELFISSNMFVKPVLFISYQMICPLQGGREILTKNTTAALAVVPVGGA